MKVLTLVSTYGRLADLDLSSCSSLAVFNVLGHDLKSLDVTNCKELKDLFCPQPATTLDVSANTELDLLYCIGNPISSLDLSKNKALINFRCDDCNRLKKSDKAECWS